jgi:hypothetical protein
MRDPGQHSAGCHPLTARHVGLEVGSRAEMPVMQDAALFADRKMMGAGLF